MPESAVYDAARNRYLVSNYSNGAIIAIDETGTQSVFTGAKASSAGLHIVGDTVYVGCGSQGVAGYNLETAALVMDVIIPGSVLLNDIDADTSGNLYVSDPYANRIYRISLSDHSYSILLDPIPWPNGLAFDAQSNRLLACTSITRFIYSINPEDGSYFGLANVGVGHLDGLAFDNAGNLYVSAQGPDAVYRYESTFLEPIKLISKGHNAPADICYDRLNEILVVPNILGHTVDFIDFSQPDLFLVGQVVSESVGDGDGHADPGETVDLSVVAFNYGQDAANVSGELRCDDPYIDLPAVASDFGPDPAYLEETASLTPFQISVDPACPDPHLVLLELDIAVEGLLPVTDTCPLLIGDTKGLDDDLEGGIAGWSHRRLTIPYADEWHLESNRVHSGSTSWKFGGAGTGSYSDFADGVLITPPFHLPPEATLTFWHWIDADSPVPGVGWDGAVVMIMSDFSAEWAVIEPVGGYPYAVASDVASPFGSGQPCFSGSHGWSQVEFDLSYYSGYVQLMFRFGTNGTGTGEGWYIDDLAVVGELCCSGRVGDANGSGEDEPTIGDVSVLIDALFIAEDMAILPCLAEADVNQSGGIYPAGGDITIGDVSYLIDYLFITGESLGLPDCM
jgi:sugar lactone lactonase YvrE